MQKARDVMTKEPVCCTRDTPVQEVAKMMCDNDCGEIPVVENIHDLRPVGVVTDRDIACRLVAEGKDPRQAKAAECMTAECVTVDLESSVEDCCRVLQENQIRRVPVVDASGRCRGIVSQADIALKMTPKKAGEMIREVSRSTAHV